MNLSTYAFLPNCMYRNSHSDTQENLRSFMESADLLIRSRILPFVPILIEINPVHMLLLCVFKIHFDNILYIGLNFHSGFLRFIFFGAMMYAFIISQCYYSNANILIPLESLYL
jgi:hypothetical protein